LAGRTSQKPFRRFGAEQLDESKKLFVEIARLAKRASSMKLSGVVLDERRRSEHGGQA